MSEYSKPFNYSWTPLIRSRLFRIPRYFELKTIFLGFLLPSVNRLSRTPAISNCHSFPLRVRNTGVQLYQINRPILSCLCPCIKTSVRQNHSNMEKVAHLHLHFHINKSLFFIWKALYADSFWNRGARYLGNGLYYSWPINYLPLIRSDYLR